MAKAFQFCIFIQVYDGDKKWKGNKLKSAANENNKF